MSDKCSIKQSLGIIVFMFYLSVKALESNDVTDYDGRKSANRDGSWKETTGSKETTPEWSTSIFTSSFEASLHLSQIKDTMNNGESLISSTRFSGESIINPTSSGRAMPPEVSTVTFTGKNNTRVTPDFATTRLSMSNPIAISALTQSGIISDRTQHKTFAISDVSYTPIASDIRLPVRTGSLQNTSNVTRPSKTVTKALASAIENKGSSFTTWTPSAFPNRRNVSVAPEQSNISFIKATYLSSLSSVGESIMAILKSYSLFESRIAPTASLVFSGSTKSTLGVISKDNASIAMPRLKPTSSALFHKQMATRSSGIDRRIIDSSTEVSFGSVVSPSTSLSAGLFYSKFAKALTTAITVSQHSEESSMIQSTGIFLSNSLSILSSYSESTIEDSSASASFKVRPKNHSLSYVFEQYLNKSSGAAIESTHGIESTVGPKGGTVMSTMSNIDRFGFGSTKSTAQSFWVHSTLTTTGVGYQRVSSSSQVKSFVVSAAIAGSTRLIRQSGTESTVSLNPTFSLRNASLTATLSTPMIQHPRTATAEPSLSVFNTVIMNMSSSLTMDTTEAGVGRYTSDVAATLSDLMPNMSFTRSLTQAKPSQSQEGSSNYAVLQTSTIMSTLVSKKHFLTDSENPISSLRQPRTSFVLVNSTIAALHSTEHTAAKSRTLGEEASSRLRMSLTVPTMNFTVHHSFTRKQTVASPVENIASTYSHKSLRSSISRNISSDMPTEVVLSFVPPNSTSLSTLARASNIKSILATSTSLVISPMTTAKTAASSTTTALEPITPQGTTQKERPVTEPRTTSQQPIYIGEPTVHTKLLAKYQFALNMEFHVSFAGIAEAYKMQIVAQKYDHRIISDNGKRLRTWYEVHYFEDYKYEPYIVVEFTKRHSVRRSNFNFTIGSDAQCEAKQVRFRYCNGPLHKGAYRFRLFYHVHGKVKRSAFSKVYTTAAVAPTPQDETSGLSQSNITVAVIVVLAVLLVIIVIIAIILYKRKNSNQNDNFGDTEMSDCTLLTSLRRTSSCSKSCYGRGAMGTADSSVMLKSLTKAMSRPVHVKDFIAWVTRSQADSDFRFAEEFESIRDVGRDQSHEASDVPENRGKNRYVNVLAYDRTRVKLSYTDDEIGSDYINANYIHGYNHPRAYIATQGPLPGTTDDFWRMIWEQNTFVIVMATQCVEVNRVKCHQYWPGVQPTAFGEIVVSLLSENSYPEWIERELLLEVEDEGSRRVRHFQYIAWPDHGVPRNAATALEFIHTVRSHVIPGQGPIVVHCSAGVGRTGTLIAIDTILNRLQEEDTIDVYLCVCFMRMQRCSMVQTEEQYIFIHRVLVEYLKSRNTASLLKGYSLLPKEENDEDIEPEGCPSTNRDSGLALLLGEYDTEQVEEALESIA